MRCRQTNERCEIRTQAYLLRRKDAAFVDPGKRELEHFKDESLTEEAFAGSSTPHVYKRLVPFRQLRCIIMCMRLVGDVDVGLCTPQGAKVIADIVALNDLRYQRRNHEGGINNFAEAELFHKIVLRTEHG